ncbi:phosphotransferase [Dactylosporangium sp. AC04546]|uniref:phosphotransferase n=1 Tax=Dactylosporangium sp. AC04546 TaxID=2862460 RepID=UPI001EDF8456|nr:phosphotransferase [Dactylosporangium sp. AC04546]WVK87800.1 phosphotransferase [Dactylosporangium sp. AC04546]
MARIGWDDLPDQVRHGVEDILGAPVASAVSQPGGFSPGTADRVTTRAGSRAFVKAVGAALNEVSPVMHRAEARVTAALPASTPTPRLLGFYDDGDWVALVFEDVDGRPPHVPWRPDELEAALEALRRLPVPVTGLPPLASQIAFDGWRNLKADRARGLDPWAAARLDELAAWADRGTAALAGTSLVHGDLRSDNLLIRADGSVVVVDWPFGSAGPPWFDTLSLILNVRLYGGTLPDSVLDSFAPDPDDVTGCVAGLAAFFTDRARLPAPPALPTLRRFQHDQSVVMLEWLRERLHRAT